MTFSFKKICDAAFLNLNLSNQSENLSTMCLKMTNHKGVILYAKIHIMHTANKSNINILQEFETLNNHQRSTVSVYANHKNLEIYFDISSETKKSNSMKLTLVGKFSMQTLLKVKKRSSYNNSIAIFIL